MFLTEEDAGLMAARGCTLVPTLAIYHELAELAAAGALREAASARVAQVAPRLGEAVAIARAAGVPIALGSDFGHRDQHGRNLVELHHLRRAGLTAEEALLAGTADGRATLRRRRPARGASRPATRSTPCSWTRTRAT